MKITMIVFLLASNILFSQTEALPQKDSTNSKFLLGISSFWFLPLPVIGYSYNTDKYTYQFKHEGIPLILSEFKGLMYQRAEGYTSYMGGVFMLSMFLGITPGIELGMIKENISGSKFNFGLMILYAKTSETSDGYDIAPVANIGIVWEF